MEIAKYLISTSFITAVIIFIGKIAVGKIFDGLVETYKCKLNIELEEFKIKQQKSLEEYKITYTKLHQDRANVINELYRKLVKLEAKINRFVGLNTLMRIENQFGTDNDENELYKNGKENYKNSIEELHEDMFNDFINYVNENALFFSEALMLYIDRIKGELKVLYHIKGLAKSFIDGEIEQEKAFISKEKVFASIDNLSDNIKLLKKLLEKEFRCLLGVETK